MPQTPIDHIPAHLLRKRGQTYVSIGPEPLNLNGFKSRLWNVTWDDRHILVRWGKSVIANNRVAPAYLQFKLHRLGSKKDVEAKLSLLISDKQSAKKGYQRITSGFSLKPVNEISSFGRRLSVSADQHRKRKQTPEVFISYAHKNKRTVFSIVRQLESSNIDIWIDGDDMLADGQPFGVQIQKAIRNAKAVVVMISKQSNRSNWVALEATYAKKFGKQLIPFYIQPVKAVGVLGLQLEGTNKIRGYSQYRGCGLNSLISDLT